MTLVQFCFFSSVSFILHNSKKRQELLYIHSSSTWLGIVKGEPGELELHFSKKPPHQQKTLAPPNLPWLPRNQKNGPKWSHQATPFAKQRVLTGDLCHRGQFLLCWYLVIWSSCTDTLKVMERL